MAKRPPKTIGLRSEPDLALKSRAPAKRDPAQPRLPFDPMPDRIQPCLALLAGDWLKIKCVQSESFVVVGYEPSTTMPGAIASLLLAARKGNSLAYVGSVGTGFKDSVARDLRKQLYQMSI